MSNIKVYATFSEEEREDGYNGTTGYDQESGLSVDHKVVLVSGYPFVYNYEDEEVNTFWVAEILTPYSELYIDFDDGTSILDEAGVYDIEGQDWLSPRKEQVRYEQVISEEVFLQYSKDYYGTYLSPAAFQRLETEGNVKWLEASWNEQTEAFIVDGKRR